MGNGLHHNGAKSDWPVPISHCVCARKWPNVATDRPCSARKERYVPNIPEGLCTRVRFSMKEKQEVDWIDKYEDNKVLACTDSYHQFPMNILWLEQYGRSERFAWFQFSISPSPGKCYRSPWERLASLSDDQGPSRRPVSFNALWHGSSGVFDLLQILNSLQYRYRFSGRLGFSCNEIIVINEESLSTLQSSLSWRHQCCVDTFRAMAAYASPMQRSWVSDHIQYSRDPMYGTKDGKGFLSRPSNQAVVLR